MCKLYSILIACVLTTSVSFSQSYQYLRVEVTEVLGNGQVHFSEIDWLVGDETYPLDPLTANQAEGVVVSSNYEHSSSAYRAFDDNASTNFYINTGVTSPPVHITVQLPDGIVPNGLRIVTPKWNNNIDEINLYGSTDGTDWVSIHSISNASDDFVTVGNSNEATFGFSLVPEKHTINVNAANGFVVLSQYKEDYATGEEITITAIPDAGYTFAGWGGDVSGTMNPQTVTIDDDLNIVANFTPSPIGDPMPFRYLRLWVLDSVQHVRELTWLSGDNEFPVESLTGPSTDDYTVSSSSTNNSDQPWFVFDGATASHWYTGGKTFHHVTLEVNQFTVLPTGVRIMTPTFNVIQNFVVQVSNDGTAWTSLYGAENLALTDYELIGQDRVGTFDFGITLPDDYDTTPPTSPVLTNITATSSMTAEASWNASSDDSDVVAYRVFVNGYSWNYTPGTETVLHGLSPNTPYDISIVAVDSYGNISSPSNVVQVTTPGLTPAVGGMKIGTNFWFRISAAADHPWRQGVNFATDTNPFNPVFIDDVTPYSVLRFLDWVPTNNNLITDWSQRRLPGDPVQESPYVNRNNTNAVKGIAYEWQIDLCNYTTSDLWLTIPHQVNDNFVVELARLVKQRLDPELKVYIEYSNEVWNNIFIQHHYAQSEAMRLKIDSSSTAGRKFYVMRSLQVHKIFETEFAEQADRVFTVLSGQSNNVNVAQDHMEILENPLINPDGRSIDYYAIAPYFGPSNANNEPDIVQAMLDDIDTKVERIIEHYQLLSGKGIPMIYYEGGQHIDAGAVPINTDPIIYDIYIEYLNKISPFAEVFAHYAHVKPSGNTNAFNAKEYTGQPNDLSFKYRALIDWQTVNGNNTGGQTPVIVKDIEDVTASEYDVVELQVVAMGAPPLQYQWYRNNTLVPDVTSSTLSLGHVTPSMSGDVYYVEVSNASGSVLSNTITVTIADVVPATIPYVQTIFEVDGIIDSEWNDVPAIGILNINNGAVDDDEDLSGSFRAAWDEQNLYLLFEVRDDVVQSYTGDGERYNFDGLEIYIDRDFSRGSSYDGNDYQYIYSTGNGTITEARRPDESLVGVTTAEQVTNDGYVVEVMIPWTTIGAVPENDMHFGFDVMLMDNDNGTTRDGKRAWHAAIDRSWTDPSLFGVVVLAGNSDLVTQTLADNRGSSSRASAAWPNPTYDVLRIELLTAGPQHFHILNAQGHSVKSGVIEQGRTDQPVAIDIKELPAGLYYLKVGKGTIAIIKR